MDQHLDVVVGYLEFTHGTLVHRLLVALGGEGKIGAMDGILENLRAAGLVLPGVEDLAELLVTEAAPAGWLEDGWRVGGLIYWVSP